MHFRSYPLLLLSIALFLSACNSTKPWYHKSQSNWEENKPLSQTATHSIYLIGDVGGVKTGELSPALIALKSQLASEGESSTVIFLGDNVWPKGIPDKDEKEAHEAAKEKTKTILTAIEGFKGKPYFIPGDRDWMAGPKNSLNNLDEQEEFLEKKIKGKDPFVPERGSFGPYVQHINDDLVLLLIDSHRWLHELSAVKDMSIDLHTANFIIEVKDVVNRFRHKTVVIAMHHPLYSNGNHGGKFGARDHLFPLARGNNKAFIPLPVVGTIYALFRKFAGRKQDLSHRRYEGLKDALLDLTADHQNTLFAASHDNSLQYFEQKGKHFIVSGSGSQMQYTRKGSGAQFTYSQQGFSKITHHNDGQVWMEIWAVNEGDKAELVFRKQLVQKKEQKAVEPVEPVFANMDAIPDSILATPSKQYGGGGFKRMWVGHGYRDAWGTEVKFPVLRLSEEQGGLKILQRGGGMQTRSLRMTNPDGKQFVLRSIEKDVRSVIPKGLHNTFAHRLIQGGISSSHPWGSISVPPMADAVGVMHTNPRLVYLPNDPDLGPYAEDFKEDLYLYEERPAGNRDDIESFGRSEDILSYRSMLKQVNKHHDHRVDQKAVLRARMFDSVLGDWDRHDDQWRWASFKEGKKTYYRPIPRDRDQVYHKFDGLLNWVAAQLYSMRKFKKFDYKIKDMQGLTHNARFFDRSFLTDLDWDDWELMAEEIQTSLTDSIIEAAIARWPKEIYQLNGEEVIAKLKQRRDDLEKYARKHYLMLAKEVDVTGTNDRDYFKIERKQGGRTKITVYELKGRKKDDKIFRRTFYKHETKEIRVYGLGGKDEIRIKGNVNKAIKLRIIGGTGEDEIVDESRVRGPSKRTKIYDTKKGSVRQLGTEARNLTRNNSDEVNEYDRRSFLHNHIMPVIFIASNPDDGFLFGGGVSLVKQGFRKLPYKSKQMVAANGSVKTGAYNVKFEGDYIDLLRKTGMELSFLASIPRDVQNFFGLGNETKPLNDDEFELNRFRAQIISLQPMLKRTAGRIHHFRYGPTYRYFDPIEKSAFTDTTGSKPLLTSQQFESSHYASVKFGYQLDKVDHISMPKKGLRFFVNTSWNLDLEDTDNQFTKLESALTLYYTFFENKFPITFAIRGGGASNFGDYRFFDANKIGGLTNLRGYREHRFSGTHSFYQNSEVRLELVNLKNYVLPFKLGLIGFADHGRVWYEDENEKDPTSKSGESEVMHHGYGCGIYINPLDATAINVTMSFSKEERIFTFGSKFFF